jgi:hypothetical protein
LRGGGLNDLAAVCYAGDLSPLELLDVGLAVLNITLSSVDYSPNKDILYLDPGRLNEAVETSRQFAYYLGGLEQDRTRQLVAALLLLKAGVVELLSGEVLSFREDDAG